MSSSGQTEFEGAPRTAAAELRSKWANQHETGIRLCNASSANLYLGTFLTSAKKLRLPHAPKLELLKGWISEGPAQHTQIQPWQPQVEGHRPLYLF